MTSPSAADALVVSAAFLRTAFGGASAVYSLRLGQPCTSVVVVHLLLPSDAAGSVRLSSDRLCFTPDNFRQPQLVRVDAVENHTQWSVITHRLYSLDRNYDRAEAPNVVVQTEATPLECPLLTFGGVTTKHKAAAMGSTQSMRLDLLAALPEDTANEAAEGGVAAAAQTQGASGCVSHLASGYHFSVAAVVQLKGATLLSWGLNTNGELGNGTMTSSPTPQQVVTFPMQLQREPLTVAHVSCGKHHVAVITGQASLFTWGSNKYGQLGLGDFSPRTQPEEVHFALATLSSHRRALRVMHTVQRGGNNVTHVACGAAHTLFVTHQQQILGMGYNQAGQLGLGHRLQQHKGWRSCTPIAVELLRDQSILDLAAGQNHSACALSNGDVYTWGCGDDGRLGDGKLGEGVANPTLVKLLREVSVRARAVRCGARHMAVISDSDLLYMWGANDFGQLGCKDKKPRSRPFLLATPLLFAEGVEDVALGEFHTTCVTSAGKAYTWGLNLRDNSALVGSHTSPQTIDLPEKERVRKISCGWTHTNIVTHVSADEASASGQGANFDRKIERERIMQRKAEVARWRAFVAATMPSTCHKTKRNFSRNAEEHPPIENTVAEATGSSLSIKYSNQSSRTTTDACISEQTEPVLEIVSSLEKLAVAYASQGMKNAEENVARLLRVAPRRNVIRSARSTQGNNNLERQSQQLKGVFYQNQLRLPDLPAATSFSSSPTSSGRKLWSAHASTSINPDWNPVTLYSPFHPTPPPHSSPLAILSKTNAFASGVQNPKHGESGVSASDTSGAVGRVPAHNMHCARTPPSLKRTTIPSPRSRITVVEALMHQPSFSITQASDGQQKVAPSRCVSDLRSDYEYGSDSREQCRSLRGQSLSMTWTPPTDLNSRAERFETSLEGDRPCIRTDIRTSKVDDSIGSSGCLEVTMADAYRPKGSTSSSIKAAYGVKGKASRLTVPKNQQSPGTVQASVLPRIDRRGELPQKSHAPLLLLSPNSAKNGGLSILLPPQRPSSKEATDSEETSPTFHGDELGGPSAKAAWCTPRNPAPELPMGSHVASFFAAPDGSNDYADGSVAIPTPLRLQSVQDSINANEERYHVDMEQLESNNDIFLEISMSANQHLEQMLSQLPNISEAFDQTASALQSLSSDIDTLHQQNENAKNDMENRFEAAMSNNAEEMVTLSETHASETAEILESHKHELQKADEAFRGKITELEEKHKDMEKKYLDELRDLQQTSDSQQQALQESNRAEKEEWKRSAKAALEGHQTKARKELDDLRSSTESAYTELQERSKAEFAELQQTSMDELAAVKKSLTAEIMSLKQNAAASLAGLAVRSERELQEHRELSNEALQELKYFYAKEREHLLEKTAEEVARLRMFEIEQCTRMENRRCQETRTLRDELEAIQTEYSTHIEQLHRRYTAELEVLKTTSEADKALLLQTHATDTESIRSTAAQKLSQTISSYEDRVQLMTEAHAAEVTQNQEEAAQCQDSLITKYESDLTSLQNERAREKDAIILHYETELEAYKQASREEHDKTAKIHETQVAQLREAHSSRVLSLEMTMREQKKQAEDSIREKEAELESRKGRIDVLETSEIALKKHHKEFAERSQALVEQKNMSLSELESEIWRLGQLNLEKDAMIDSTNQTLKAAEEDLHVKANTILELTFVIKSRDDEIEKLRNALLDTVQTVNTKTEILELTTETLSSKAKELEATKNALRLESGKLSIVEESMNQKVGMLENTGLKMESMRLNMENMRLEMKRMQMDMKLQLEHTEGEIELKNGEIRRLHGTQSELKQKNDFCQQTIERLEESLALSQRQGEEAQRRIELLRLEATQSAEDLKKVCDELLDKEQNLVILTREKQMIAMEKQRQQIQINNLTHVTQTLHEKLELHTMQAEEIQCQCQRLLEETTAEKDERIRSEKHLHMLELSASKDMIRHLEGVEVRFSDTTSRLKIVTSEKQHLEAEIKSLHETLKKLQATNEDIGLKNKLVEAKVQEFADLNKMLCKSEDEAQHHLDMSRMEMEDLRSNVYRLMCGKDEVARLNFSLESILLDLRVEKEQLMLSLGQEKREIVSRAEDLQEKVAGLRKEGARAASEASDLQHALSEKKKELKYLQENLGEQTADTRKIKSALDALSNAHNELQVQFDSLSDQREKENEENLDTIRSLQQNLESKTKECAALQQSLDIQRQELDLLMVQHDSHVVQLADGHRSEAVQLIESHRFQITRVREENVSQVTKLSNDQLTQITKLKEDHLSEVNKLAEERRSEVSQLTEEHQSEISRLVEEHRSENAQVKQTHQAEIDLLTDDLRYQVSEITVHRLSQMTEQAEEHRTEVSRLEGDHSNEVMQLTEAHRARVSNLTEEHLGEISMLSEEHLNRVLRLSEEHRAETARLLQERDNLATQLRGGHRNEVAHLTVDDITQSTEVSGDDRVEVPRLVGVPQMKEDHRSERGQLIGGVHQQLLLFKQAADEQIRVDCAHSLELMIIQVAHQQELNETFKASELLEKARVEEERHAAALATVHEELSDKSNTLNTVEDLVAAMKAEISELQTQLQNAKQEVSERDAVVAAKNATVDNVRKELNLLLETSKSSRSSEQFVALLRQQLETHMMEVYHVELSKLEGFVLEEEGDLLGYLIGFFAMRCHRGVAPPGPDGHPEANKAVSNVEDMCEHLQEYDRVTVALDQVQASFDDNDKGISPSQRIASLLREIGRLRLLDLRSTEILDSREEAAAFVERCKNALLLPADDDMSTPDDIVEAIEELMKIPQHFELLQPKLGSPRRRPTATDPTPTLENKVTAVLVFVEELQLMADFAQNILSDESKGEGEPSSNESSRSSLEALRALTRTPSPAPTLDELKIDVDIAVDDAIQGVDQNLCEFSNEEADKQQDAFFSSSGEKFSSRSPSPFLADSLMDISLVMSDHHRLLSQTARWIAKSRTSGPRSQTFSSVGTEISRLVREHCALLSLSRRLFKMKDPRQELVSLLEGVALLERMTGRLALFQASSIRDTDPDSYGGGPNPSESATSLGKSDIDSIESQPRPVLASIGDMARHLQDYDFFLQQIKLGECRMDCENNSPAVINIEELVQEINERVMLVEQSKVLLGLPNPIDELPPFLVGAQEVLRQAKELRGSSACFEKSSRRTDGEPHEVDATDDPRNSGNGIELMLSEMDAVVEDLRGYNSMLAWMRRVLPQPESLKPVADLKDRVKAVLTQVETLTSDKANLMQEKAKLKTDLEQMEQKRNHLAEEASKESTLLQELAALEAQASLSPVEETSTRIELLQTLIKQQQRICDEAEQRRADMETETTFLRQHDLQSERDDADKDVFLSTIARTGIYNRLLECVDNLRLEKREMETSLNEEIQRRTERLENVESELAQARQEMEDALADERAFLESKEVFSSILSVGHTASGAFSRIEVYQQLHDEISRLLGEKRAVESCAAQEYEFLQGKKLLAPNGESVLDTTVPTTSALSSIRLGIFQHLVDSLAQLHQHEDDLAQETRFLQEHNLAFDLKEPQNSRLAVYETLLAGRNALIEEKMEREVVAESENAFLASHGVPAFANPMEIYEQFVVARKQVADLATELEEEVQFLAENQLCSSNELSHGVATLTTPFSWSVRLQLYRKFLQTEVQARETNQQLTENMEQQLSRQIAGDESVIASLTAKVERLEASLMGWQESAYASQREWDRMRLEEEDKHRSLIRHHEDVQKQAEEEHARALEEVIKARDSAMALASATHAEALEHAAEEHERRLATELHKQAQQLELAAFVHAESETHKQASDMLTSHTSMSISAAQTRAQLLERFAKRDTTAISRIYKAIRLTTDILSATPCASAVTPATSTPRTIPGNTSEVSTDVTQTVLACVKELKALKEFLVQSLEHMTKDDDHVPPPFAKAPHAKWVADAVTRATTDKECAIDLALCSHREFMSFAEVQLLARQEEVEKALARVYEKLKAAATNGAFTTDQEKLLALELEVTREREARENVACKFRLNEEYYRRLLDERKEMEIAQTANVEGLREECKALRLNHEKLEQQLQQQTVPPQFRPPSSNTYTPSPRASVVSPQTPRVLKSAAVSNVPMPMRPERPRGGGSAHKERFVSDLERETGQRRTGTAARRFNEWRRAREEVITENPGSQLEQNFRAMQAEITSHHASAMEPVVPTAMTAPATAPGSSLQNQELWYQGVRSIHYVSFFISIFHVPRQQLFRVEVFNSDTEQQQQTVYVTWTEMQAFLQESRKAVRLGIALPADPEMAVAAPQHVRADIIDVLFERIRVYGEGTGDILLGFE